MIFSEANYENAVIQLLVKLGYTNVREFGGILDWPYEVQ